MPALTRAADAAEARAPERSTKRAKAWHDNERFLLCPATYKRHGLEQLRFPPTSGDLTPSENAWAQLRKDLAVRAQEDLSAGRQLSTAQFRQRVAQILKQYSEVQPGETHSYLTKLVLGMPRRLAMCRRNKYGRSGR